VIKVFLLTDVIFHFGFLGGIRYNWSNVWGMLYFS
jgi:hypothetical protein